MIARLARFLWSSRAEWVGIAQEVRMMAKKRQT